MRKPAENRMRVPDDDRSPDFDMGRMMTLGRIEAAVARGVLDPADGTELIDAVMGDGPLDPVLDRLAEVGA